PDGASLVVSSSMPIRDLEWYAPPRRGVRVLANRGANGIDGVMSTAVGVAIGSRAPTVCLIGDVAFVHDTNALAGLRDRGVDLLIVVVDNDGGGIFSFLPQAEVLPEAQFEQLFGTPHGTDLAGLARAHGIRVDAVGSAGELGSAVTDWSVERGTRVLIVDSDRGRNVEVHRALNDAVARSVDS
ncbi:MAG TPA: thiamine pyrophosphate-dependent enzyme, partial [Microthrixaceae bacterium]|nr:thiamine pyrophosphate-dependent enzyme [Microthrixaceae bacterium]